MTAPLTRTDVLERLDAVRDRLVDALETLSDAQWNWAPDQRAWSAAHIAEHLAVIAYGTSRMLTDRFETLEPASFTPEQQARKDARIPLAVANRGVKLESPEHVRPKSRWSSRAETMAKLLYGHDAVADAVRNATVDLRSRTAPHPYLGAFDGMQWAVFTAAHADRHLAQLDELRALPGFPAT
ncbi:MAG: DinB family protein [Gemmatimonadetes bacterium]|nr:DinB family protein [Gemmatimonadota bacterium]